MPATLSLGKTLITGASSGVGRALALRLAGAPGAAESSKFGLHLCGRNAANLDETAHACKALAPDAVITTSAGDLQAMSAVDTMWNDYLKAHGEAIDVCVANAGINRPGAVGTNTEDDYNTVMDTNLKAAWAVFSKATPIMIQQKSGQLVATNSVRAIRGAPNAGLYTASKFGLRGLMVCMRYELKPHGVKCGAVLPGGIATEWWLDQSRGGRPTMDDNTKNELFQKFLLPEDVAESIMSIVDQGAGSDIDEIVMSQLPPYDL